MFLRLPLIRILLYQIHLHLHISLPAIQINHPILVIPLSLLYSIPRTMYHLSLLIPACPVHQLHLNISLRLMLTAILTPTTMAEVRTIPHTFIQVSIHTDQLVLHRPDNHLPELLSHPQPHRPQLQTNPMMLIRTSLVPKNHLTLSMGTWSRQTHPITTAEATIQTSPTTTCLKLMEIMENLTQ